MSNQPKEQIPVIDLTDAELIELWRNASKEIFRHGGNPRLDQLWHKRHELYEREYERRSREAASNATLRLTKQAIFLTWVIATATVVNVVVAALNLLK